MLLFQSQRAFCRISAASLYHIMNEPFLPGVMRADGPKQKPGGCGQWNKHKPISVKSVRYSSVHSLSRVWLLRPHESQHSRPPCPSPTPGVYANPCPSSQWHHPAISSSVVPFSSCPQSLPASRSFPMSELFSWGGQSIGVSASASVLSMNTQDWSPLGWTGWISLQLFNNNSLGN